MDSYIAPVQLQLMNDIELSGEHLLHNLTLFGRLLRGLGLDVNPGRMIDVMQALDYTDIRKRRDFYYTLRGLLVHRKEEIPLFDEAFKLFWREPAYDLTLEDLMEGPTVDSQQPKVIPPPPPEPEDKEEAEGDDEENEEESETVIEVTRTYSDREILRRKDFGELTPDEMRAVKQLMSRLVWQIGQRRTRRQRLGDGRKIDLRRTLRRNFRYGGEIMEWPRRQQKLKPRPLVVIADVSGSMERYSRMLLHFTYSLAQGLEQPVEAFVFSTRLTRITYPLRDKDIDRALQEVSSSIMDWSGGTRIGEALRRFNFDWGRRVLRGGAIVLLISDGWDRGDPDLLAKEMARLHRSCYRLIWLNPLLGSASYEPLTRGMVAALPHVDEFLPVHNLGSLEELAAHLIRLNRR